MNAIVEMLSSEFTAHLIFALVHTLWQGLAIAGVLYVILRSTNAPGLP